MPVSYTPILELEEFVEGQGLPETKANEHDRWFDFFASGAAIIDRDLAAEPGAPADGDAYLVAASATGTNWAGQDGKIALFINTAWAFKTPKEGMQLYVKDEDIQIVYSGAAWSTSGATPETITVALSDLTSDLTTGTDKNYWDPPAPIVLTGVSATVFEAPTDAAIEIDINEAGVSVLSTVISIDATQVRSADSATPPVISDNMISGRLTFDIDQVGSTNAGKGAQVTLTYLLA